MVHPILPLVLAATLLPSGEDESYDGAALELSIETPMVLDAQIRIDGLLGDMAWEGAAVLHSFTQYSPVEGVSASQKTEVLVLVDDEAVYFAVRAFDDSPSGIRATLAARSPSGRGQCRRSRNGRS